MPAMLDFMRADVVIANALAVIAQRDREPPVDDLALRARLHHALARLQRYRFAWDPEDPWPHLDFAIEHADTAAHFLGRAIESAHRCDSGERNRLTATLPRAYAEIAAYDPDLLAVLRLIVAGIVVAKLPGHGGGSMGDTIGLVWIEPGTFDDALDLADKLVHETTHQCLFLHEMVHGLFRLPPDRMRDDDLLIRSALLEIPRGYARSFHSACVGASLVAFHRARGRTSVAERLLPRLRTTVAQLADKQRSHAPLRASGLAVLDQLAAT